MMAHVGAMGATNQEDCENTAPSVCLRSRPCSNERDNQVRIVKSLFQARLGPYEPILTYLQSVLVWERPFQSVLLYIVVNAVFWFFALTSLRMLSLVASGLAAVVCVDTWRNKIWPQIRVNRPDESENESWGLVQPGILSVPELCHHMAEAWVSGAALISSAAQYKRVNPGKFCLQTYAALASLALVGSYVPGLVLSYSVVLFVLLAPLAAHRRFFQHARVRLEPILQRLDFSIQGYMMSKPIDNQFLRKPILGASSGEGSDSDEELSAFCPTFDDALVAKELEMTDSEHSDAEMSYTENGTFNLSRGQTPLTEGSEDFDRHSDPEESFAQDLQDFPSINPDATLMDDDDDTSIGLPSLGPFGPASQPPSVLDLDSDQDDLDTELSLGGMLPTSDLSGDLAGMITSNMIQAALAGALQPRPPAGQQRRVRPPRAGARRSYRKQSSSELDTDLDGEDFEMLDQSELNLMDPFGGTGGARPGDAPGSNFLSNLLGGKPQ